MGGAAQMTRDQCMRGSSVRSSHRPVARGCTRQWRILGTLHNSLAAVHHSGHRIANGAAQRCVRYGAADTPSRDPRWRNDADDGVWWRCSFPLRWNDTITWLHTIAPSHPASKAKENVSRDGKADRDAAQANASLPHSSQRLNRSLCWNICSLSVQEQQVKR